MRAHHTVEAVVGGVVGPLDAPDALVLGRVDEQGRLRVVERTTPLTLPARREIGAVLAAPRSVHPWPAVLPANRFGHRSSDDVAYTPTEPNVVVELDADTAFERGRWRHPHALPALSLHTEALGSGSPRLPAAMFRLLVELEARGQPVQVPRCARCGQRRVLRSLGEGGRICALGPGTAVHAVRNGRSGRRGE